MSKTETTDNTSAKVEEIRERWAHKMKTALDIFAAAGQDAIVPRDQQALDIAFLLHEFDYLTAELAKLAAIAEDGFVQRERERDALRAEVERLKALNQAGTLSCPDCEWSGQEVDLVQKMSGALCPSCSRVLRWLGGLRVSVAEVKPDLRPLMVEGWEMPEAPEEGWVPLAWLDDIEGCWSVQWVDAEGQGVSIEHDIPCPFREGVTVTADMLRALGFTVEEG